MSMGKTMFLIIDFYSLISAVQNNGPLILCCSTLSKIKLNLKQINIFLFVLYDEAFSQSIQIYPV